MGKYKKQIKSLKKVSFTLKMFRKHSTLNWLLKQNKEFLEALPKEYWEREKHEREKKRELAVIALKYSNDCAQYFIQS